MRLDVFYSLPMAKQLGAGGLKRPADRCANECLLPPTPQRGAGAGSGLSRNQQCSQLKTRQLGCLQKLAEWRLRHSASAIFMVNFVVRARRTRGRWRALCRLRWENWICYLERPEIRYHGKTPAALVAEAEALEESDVLRRWSLTLSISRATRRCL